MKSQSSQMKLRISGYSNEKVFIAVDFADIADLSIINDLLDREEQNGSIKRIFQDYYYKPMYSELLGEYEAPVSQEIASAIARKYGWNIAPSGNTALNLLGVSTQVPAKWVYISDGPDKRVKIDKLELEFKHEDDNNLKGLGYKSSLVVQAIKAIGVTGIGEATIARISSRLNDDEKRTMLIETKNVTAWIYDVIKRICGVSPVEKKQGCRWYVYRPCLFCWLSWNLYKFLRTLGAPIGGAGSA